MISPRKKNGWLPRRSSAFLALLLMCAAEFVCLPITPVSAIPSGPIAISEMSGTVKDAAWRSGLSFKRTTFRQDGSPRENTVTLKPHWVLVLSNLEGLSEKDASQMSYNFSLNEPQDSVKLSYKPDKGEVYLWLPGAEGLNIRPGSRIALKGVRFEGDEWGGGLTYESIAIEPAEGEAEQLTPSDRSRVAMRDPFSTHVLIAAHRGGYANDKPDGAPENSVANIDVAFRKGFDVYETDIRRTRDGVFVIVHDDTLDRETTGTGPVEALDWSEVAKLKKRYRDGTISDQPVARLEDFLKAGKGKVLFKADLKPGIIEHFESLARLIAAHNMADHVILRARWKDAPAIDQAFRNGAPWVSVMFQVDSAGQVRKAIETFGVRDHYTNGAGQGTLQESRGIETIQVNLAKGETLTNNPEKLKAIQAARDSGLLVETHNYNDPALWDQLIEAGVRMFHTTAPEETLTHLRSRGLHW